MPRNRINYASQALYVGPTPATGFHFNTGVSGALGQGNNLINELFRVQTCNEKYALTRRDVNQFGEFAALDRVVVDSPTASIDFTYLLASLSNEAYLGFTINPNVSAISGMLNGSQDSKNYFLKIAANGVDAINDATQNCFVMGIGNGFVSSYSVTAGVGKFPEASVKIDALNVLFQTTTSGVSPAINPVNGAYITGCPYTLPLAIESPGVTGDLATSVLRPGDITLTLLNHGTNNTYALGGESIIDAKIQQFTLGVNLTREEIQELGSRFAISRELRFPILATLSIDAIVGDLTTGNLGNLITCDQAYDAIISITRPLDCLGSAQVPVVVYKLLSCKLDSKDFSSSITANTTVKLQFTSQVGGPNQTGVGLFMSGIAAIPAS